MGVVGDAEAVVGSDHDHYVLSRPEMIHDIQDEVVLRGIVVDLTEKNRDKAFF